MAKSNSFTKRTASLWGVTYFSSFFFLKILLHPLFRIAMKNYLMYLDWIKRQNSVLSSLISRIIIIANSTFSANLIEMCVGHNSSLICLITIIVLVFHEPQEIGRLSGCGYVPSPFFLFPDNPKQLGDTDVVHHHSTTSMFGKNLRLLGSAMRPSRLDR